MRFSMVISLAALATLVASCGTFRAHRLPYPAAKAHETFSPIAACADAAGLMVSEHPDSVHVQYDQATWIQFMIQNNAYNMVLAVDDKAVSPNEVAARFDAARSKGDELYQCALGHLKAMPPTATPVTVVPTSGICDQLGKCYTALATSLCEPSNQECSASFEITIEGHDDGLCRDALTHVPLLVQPWVAVRPGFEMPRVCR
ncbi:hypothetical protein ACFL6C_10345 [Myxococcota bacterium]